MTRRPNFGTSQWAKPLDRPAEEPASCFRYPKLPWTDDKTPDDDTLTVMRDICSTCPNRVGCAVTGLQERDGGGMHAGIWLPWKNDDRRSLRDRRESAVRALERVARGK